MKAIEKLQSAEEDEMKAFGEYSDKQRKGHQWKEDLRRTHGKTWRAALEWLRDNEDAHCCGDCDAVGDWTDCPKNTTIKQELEGEDE